MSISKHKKKLLAALGVVSLFVVAGVAVAYFTAGGSGTGSATVGTSTAFTIHPTVASTLYPGQSSSVSFTVDNGGSGNQEIASIHLAGIHACVGAGSSWTGTQCSSSGTEATTCESAETGGSDTNTANFWMPDVAENQDIAGSTTGAAATNSGSLKMNDLTTSQDACKNANLTLSFTSS